MSDEWFVTMPKLGETVTEGELTTWLKNVGDPIAFDDPLFEVSTDKVDSEIPSPYDGVLAEILVPAGQTVPIGTQLARIVPEGASIAPSAGRLPETGHKVVAAGGPALGDGAAPQMGGSEGPADESPGVSAPSGVVHDINMPKLGETVTEGELTSWLKNVGDAIEMDDALFEVSTDKVDSEIPSPYDGVLLEILVPAGTTVPIGTPVARIGEPGATVGVPAGGAPSSGSSSAGPGSSTSATIVIGAKAEPGRMLSPLVRRLAAENNLDVSAISGTGVGGRIRREDVEQALANGGTKAPAAPAPVQPTAPSAAPAAATAATTAPRPAVPAGVSDPRDEVVTLSRMRIAVANGMVASLAATASVWTSVEVDFDNVEQVRRKHKDRFKKETGASLSYLPFVSRATIDALRAYPTVNSSIDLEAKTMTLHPYVNLGVAVDLDQQGLVVPVVKDADSLNMRGVAKKITELAGAARSKKLGSEDMKGSTFTITNPGPFASYASSPIINQPNVAILCTDGVKRRPVAVGDTIAIHPTGIIGMVYDHRAFDGSTASLFLMHIRDSLEQRDWAAEVG
jgi:2-oxoglutarate dehydrogenase E2 component (dihydrolipoamide succinyltransferase)